MRAGSRHGVASAPGLLQAVAAASAVLTRSPSPRLDAELLLAHALRVRRLDLYLQSERVLEPEEAAEFQRLIEARQADAPVAYLTRRKEFFGLELEVTPDVLIPRPETERLVEVALEWARGHPVRYIADIGTGSGGLALALAHHLPEALVEATDISPAALAVAARNGDRLGLAARIRWLAGDVADPLTVRAELLVANLPYIADPLWDQLPPCVRLHEPPVALRGGPDGLEIYRLLLARLKEHLAPGALVALEMDPQQRAELHQLVQTGLQPAQIDVVPDLAGRDRVLVARC